MKRITSIIAVLIFPLLLNAWSLFGEDKDIKDIDSSNSIAVGKFQLKGNTSSSQYADLLSGFRSYVEDSFSKYGDFKVINKRKVDEIMSTNGLYKSIEIKQTSKSISIEAIKKYKEFDAQYVLLGEIRNFSLDKLRGSKINNGTISTLSKKQILADIDISIALIHVKTQQIIAKENLLIKKVLDDSSNSDTLVGSALNMMAEELVSKLLLSLSKDIKVISVQDNEVVINKGNKSGIKEGMSFEVFKLKKIDKYTSQTKVASIKIKRVDKDISFASLENIIELPQNGYLVKFVNKKQAEFQNEKIRVSIAQTIIQKSNIKSTTLKNYINRDMEYAFSQNSAFVVTNNDKSQTNKILAQQVLDELGKGRESGLPLGSLRGVDFLVFNTIEYLQFNNGKIKLENLKSLGVLNTSKKNAEVKLSGYVYLIDVNTANKVANVPVNVVHEFKEDKLVYEEMMKILSKKFVQEASKIIFSKISPTRVIKVTSSGNVILNSGLNLGLKKGDTLDVFGDSEIIRDEYTNTQESIAGEKFAKIEIIDFTPSGKAIAKVIEGRVYKKGNLVRLVLNSVTKEETKRIGSSSKNISKSKNDKKYIVIKDLLIDSTISKYKHKYIKESKIDTKIKASINKSKIFKTLSRDKEQIKQLLQEKEIAKSSISDDYDDSSRLLSLADYILIPKVTRFKLSRTSKKIENIDAYENVDFIELSINLVLMNTKGEVLFDSTKSDKYRKSWASDNKLKSTIPSSKNIYKLVKKVVNKSIDDVINNKLDITKDGLLTVVEVGVMTIFVDLADKKDVKTGDEYYVYTEPKVKELSRTGKKRLSYGSRVAEVKIDVLFDDGAEAVVIKGNIEDIKENYILRSKSK